MISSGVSEVSAAFAGAPEFARVAVALAPTSIVGPARAAVAPAPGMRACTICCNDCFEVAFAGSPAACLRRARTSASASSSFFFCF